MRGKEWESKAVKSMVEQRKGRLHAWGHFTVLSDRAREEPQGFGYFLHRREKS